MARTKQQEEAAVSWGELPLEVQCSVLGGLPLRPLFRSMLVCKLWNAAISAPSFTHFPSSLPSPSNPPWLIFFSRKCFDFLLAFDFEAFSWFKLDLGFLSSSLNSMHASLSAPCVHQGAVWCAGSASGLLLFDVRSSLHVCNPITKFVFRLPPFKSIAVRITQGFSSTHIRSLFTKNAQASESMPTHGTDSKEGFLMDTHRENHVMLHPCRQLSDGTLIAIGKANTDLAIEAYCADSNSWEIVGSVPIYFLITWHDQMVECNGLFYSLLANPMGMLVVGENDGKGGPIWRIQEMPANHGKESCNLLACQNAIFMVCHVDEHFNALVIWRYQSDSRAWIKMQAMPYYIVQDACYAELHRCLTWVDCVGVGSLICFRVLGSLRMLTYNLCNDLWSWLPEPLHAYDSVYARGLPFEPRLDYRSSF